MKKNVLIRNLVHSMEQYGELSTESCSTASAPCKPLFV